MAEHQGHDGHDGHAGEHGEHGELDDERVFSQAFWDERYAAHDRVWSGLPNQRLVEHAGGLAPGLALDVGCGEGADVVWLAERGWRVTGADVSVVALDKARQHAGEAGVADRTDWVHADLVAGDPLPGGADLVTAMYVHVPDAHFDRVYSAIAGCVRPGGTLIVAGHHPDERRTDLRNQRLSHLLFAPERVTSVLTDGWEVDVAEARTRDFRNHDGEPRVATDTVVVARRG
jgi:2-polyprenyl-3-methyl-5-hydroxy-6-metoxy-1,4-benzoquinol methylase